jgi:lipopolysaccharide export LptBFGC system permease protein LptF
MLFMFYAELAVALLIMALVLMSVVVFSERVLFPILEARDLRREEKARNSEQSAKDEG